MRRRAQKEGDTPIAAPASWLDRSARSSAASSTIPPRAVLTTTADGLSNASSASETRFLVAGTSGQCSESTSSAGRKVASEEWRVWGMSGHLSRGEVGEKTWIGVLKAVWSR